MKNAIINMLRKARLRALTPAMHDLGQQEQMIRLTAEAGLITRAMVKRSQKKTITVLLVCHEPSFWNMFESLYRTVKEDSGFSVNVVAMPYNHSSLPKGQFKDAGMLDFLQAKGIEAIQGYSPEQNKWVNPAVLQPDYVFFQNPYELFPRMWSAEYVSLIARVCYIPYATCILKGHIHAVVHPPGFLKFTHLIFTENTDTRMMLKEKFNGEPWLDLDHIVGVGNPKLEYLANAPFPQASVWRRGVDPKIKRILWTPRWNTGEGNCHFFDYKGYFEAFCAEHAEVDFALRPHPLCFQNFLKTGEMTKEELSEMELHYAQTPNMVIDKTGGYENSFLTSDILISDVSSLLMEYIVIGKPIIYTHRVDHFNDLWRHLSSGFYWVRNKSELANTLKMLLAGDDPLQQTRMKLKEQLLGMQKGGSSKLIMEALRFDFERY
jgi:hypothetical protein